MCTYKLPGTFKESDSTICCMCTTVPSWRWALEARNMYRRLIFYEEIIISAQKLVINIQYMKILYAFFVSATQTTRPAHHMPFDSIIQMTSYLNTPDTKFFVTQFSPVSCYTLSLRPTPSHLQNFVLRRSQSEGSSQGAYFNFFLTLCSSAICNDFVRPACSNAARLFWQHRSWRWRRMLIVRMFSKCKGRESITTLDNLMLVTVLYKTV